MIMRALLSTLWVWRLNVMCQWTHTVSSFSADEVYFCATLLRATLGRESWFLLFSQPFSLALISALCVGGYVNGEDWGATGFCMENFANCKRHNKLPLRSSSPLLPFPFICHFISCSQTFTCISAPLLNVTAVFVHLQIKLFGLLQSSQGIYLAAKRWHWNSTEDYIVLCWWCATAAVQKKWFGGDWPCVLISLRSLPFQTTTNTKATDVSGSMLQNGYWG